MASTEDRQGGAPADETAEKVTVDLDGGEESAEDLLAAAGDGDDGAIDLEEGTEPDFDAALPEPQTVPYAPDRVRAQVARALIVILAVVILFSFLTLWMSSPDTADLEKLLTIIFGPLIALVSGAVGYYFGGKSDSA